MGNIIYDSAMDQYNYYRKGIKKASILICFSYHYISINIECIIARGKHQPVKDLHKNIPAKWTTPIVNYRCFKAENSIGTVEHTNAIYPINIPHIKYSFIVPFRLCIEEEALSYHISLNGETTSLDNYSMENYSVDNRYLIEYSSLY